MKTRNYCQWIIAIVFALSCANWSVAQKKSVHYRSSENGKYVVRIEPGNGNPKAKAMVFDFSNPEGDARLIAKVDLPNVYMPLDSIIANDGRYLINLGNFTGGTDVSAAVSIFDLQLKTNKVFSFLDMFDKDETDNVTAGAVRFQFWFQDFHVDESKRKVFLTGYNNKDKTRLPTIEVDYGKMTVSVRKADFWKAKLDELTIRSEAAQDSYEEFLSVEEYNLMERILATKLAPSIEHQGIGKDTLFRLLPASAGRKPKIFKYQFDRSKQSFEFVESIPLKNPVSPSRWGWTVSPDARFLITYDEIDAIGTTSNALVIYDLELDRSKAFSLEDFCSESDLSQMAQAGKIRMWRLSRPWIFLSDDRYENWPPRVRLDTDKLVPKVIVELEKLEVRLASPFFSK